MNEQVKKRKRVQKRVRHEATKKKRRKHRIIEADAGARKEIAKQDSAPIGESSAAAKHRAFMSKHRK